MRQLIAVLTFVSLAGCDKKGDDSAQAPAPGVTVTPSGVTAPGVQVTPTGVTAPGVKITTTGIVVGTNAPAQPGPAGAAAPASGACTDGKCTQACNPGQTCNFSCSGGGCVQTCAAGSTCSFSCSGGSCKQGCAGAASCNKSCSGGGCS